jgi:hypothetical protein
MAGGNLKSFVQPAGADPAQREGSNALPGKADIESGFVADFKRVLLRFPQTRHPAMTTAR